VTEADGHSDAATVLVTGARGQLGARTAAFWSDRGPVRACGRQDLDLGDAASVSRLVGGLRPAIILNCAADNRVDRAETDPLPALAVNAFALRTLARAAAAVGATLVHYSSDFVFDGEANAPYTETDEPRPRSVYGASKLLGEWLALQYERSYVLRVESLFGGPAPRSSLDKIADALLGGRETTVFVDRVISPSYVEDVVLATARLLDLRAPYGLYHCVNDGAATWDQVARELARLAGVEARLKPLRMSEVALAAHRPRYCALSGSRLRQAGVPMPSWQDALRRFLAARQDASRAG
jgi:dTDP-4-dehydrorhamnose reductase